MSSWTRALKLCASSSLCSSSRNDGPRTERASNARSVSSGNSQGFLLRSGPRVADGCSNRQVSGRISAMSAPVARSIATLSLPCGSWQKSRSPRACVRDHWRNCRRRLGRLCSRFHAANGGSRARWSGVSVASIHARHRACWIGTFDSRRACNSPESAGALLFVGPTVASNFGILIPRACPNRFGHPFAPRLSN